MLRVKDLTIKLDHQTVFEGLNCTFSRGEFWGIVGQNGVGKTSLLQAMVGIHAPHQGDILIDQQPLSQLPTLTRAQKLSFLLQDQEPCLPFSVKDAVGMGRYPWQTKRTEDDQITQAALQTCRINELADRSILKLSGGERRKVEIATCLAQQSDFLLLDEPLNHLDLVYRQHILSTFKAFSDDHCVIMVCHDLEAVKQHCSHVLMLLANHCYLAGTSDTILTADNLKRLFNDHSQQNQK